MDSPLHKKAIYLINKLHPQAWYENNKPVVLNAGRIAIVQYKSQPKNTRYNYLSNQS